MPLVSGRKGRKSDAKKYKRWDDVYAAIESGELNPKEDDYYLTYGGLDIWNTKEKEQEANSRYDIYSSKQEEQTAIEEREIEHKATESALLNLLENWPELASNEELIKELRTTLDKGLGELKGVVTDVEERGSKYLSNLEKKLGLAEGELTRAEKTAKEGLQKGLDIYRDLAKRTTLPGEEIIKEQLDEEVAGGIANIKKYGGGRGLSSVTDLYKQRLTESRALGLERAGFLTQQKQNLAGAEQGYGVTMADIIRGNALSKADMATNFYSAQSDWLNKLSTAKTNVAGATMDIGKTIYDVEAEDKLNQYLYNELTPTQIKANYLTQKTFATDPFETKMNITGRNIGYAYSDLWTSQKQQAENNRQLFNMIGEGVKLYLTGGTSAFGNMFKSGQTGFGSMPNFNKQGDIVPYDYTPSSNNWQNYLG